MHGIVFIVKLALATLLCRSVTEAQEGESINLQLPRVSNVTDFLGHKNDTKGVAELLALNVMGLQMNGAPEKKTNSW
jgi:hypothetical protein